ncbi:hypothetical protein EQG68_10195 [Flavobacterium piscinae]|uniref:Uncharacterized protein n=1 Tax=Flavobacterium piscinae TaxID=2506424 RepID=A0A4Q1KMV0_9FLAO|nr:hypothetical protein [Flavobacterium piscinae]RXR31248.1 hypothetical protein EQG68_10195 [Flavobacterium piscinae]
MEIPTSYIWFLKLKLTKFIPWQFDIELNLNSVINQRFKEEHSLNREVLTFGKRQDMDTFAGFEIKNGKVCENVVVFHLSFQKNTSDWNIIENEYSDFFEFIQNKVLPEMKECIKDEI